MSIQVRQGVSRSWAPWAAACAVLLAAWPAAALINPNYTPVDLVRQSEVILRLELGEPDADGKLAVRGVQAVQGNAPPRLDLVLDKSLAADFNDDGATDAALVAANGEVWVLYHDAAGPTLGVTASLPDGCPGPVNVVASDGKRSLGARLLTPGSTALFGKPAKGPLDLQWRLPGGQPQTRRVVVVKPSRLVLPIEGR